MSMDQQHTPDIIGSISFKADRRQLQRILHVRDDSRYLPMLMDLVDEAENYARPESGFIGEAYVEEGGEDWVDLDGKRFISRVMRVNLEEAGRAFFFVAICGRELEEWSLTIQGLCSRKFWGDAIKEMALASAVRALEDHLRQRFQINGISAMNPGSLADWPLTAQPDVFAMLGDGPSAIGVTLSQSCAMNPVKSVSGIYFPTVTSFASCQLCPRENCRGRKAPFEPNLFEKRYQVSQKAG